MFSIASIRPTAIALVAGAAALLVMLLSTSGALAAPNPSGSGQPTASCEAPSTSTTPNGFQTAGFAHAEQVYAGAGHSTNSNNAKAVSQYDVACYQLSSKPH